jgi:hypothetical protein
MQNTTSVSIYMWDMSIQNVYIYFLDNLYNGKFEDTTIKKIILIAVSN